MKAAHSPQQRLSLDPTNRKGRRFTASIPRGLQSVKYEGGFTMQIERFFNDRGYLEAQVMKGGVFFQHWTQGILPDSPHSAWTVAHDAVYIFGKRKPLPETITRVLKEVERQALDADLLPIVFTLGWMVGKAHERWRVKDPEAKHLLKAARRKGARA
jgi:hypothetical protein